MKTESHTHTAVSFLGHEHTAALFDMAAIVASRPETVLEDMEREILILQFAAYLNALAYQQGAGERTVSENCFSRAIH